ncbi:hypothetical protein CBR_g66726 [Chara braunii]|uniref:Uncharacterized protein n=1 Tax=Chara braunii TaxID=69332 RepID=A0A388JQ57_CHABU|nr:hypothetical protein CBR_g66726 [Chara braunii]|eukprot:GBG59920.1 hypothetical protein CBR_g66726 [Chara braunii]
MDIAGGLAVFTTLDGVLNLSSQFGSASAAAAAAAAAAASQAQVQHVTSSGGSSPQEKKGGGGGGRELVPFSATSPGGTAASTNPKHPDMPSTGSYASQAAQRLKEYMPDCNAVKVEPLLRPMMTKPPAAPTAGTSTALVVHTESSFDENRLIQAESSLSAASSYDTGLSIDTRSAELHSNGAGANNTGTARSPGYGARSSANSEHIGMASSGIRDMLILDKSLFARRVREGLAHDGCRARSVDGDQDGRVGGGRGESSVVATMSEDKGPGLGARRRESEERKDDQRLGVAASQRQESPPASVKAQGGRRGGCADPPGADGPRPPARVWSPVPRSSPRRRHVDGL